MRVIINRLEEKFAICENEEGETINILRDMIPIVAKAQDVLYIDGDVIHIDRIETEARKNNVN